MAPVNGKPFLHYVIQYLQQQAITHFIFSLGYKHEIISSWLEENHTNMDYAIVLEDEPLGTGGAILKSCESVRGQHAIVTNGDTLFTASLSALSHFHIHTNAHCSLALKPMQNFDRYGVVTTNAAGRVTSFLEKKHYEQGLINGGIYALQVEYFGQPAWPEKFSFEKDYLEKNVTSGNLFGLEQDAYFIDIGIPEDFERAQDELGKGLHAGI